MQHNYRAYLLGWDGHIVNRVEITECDNDDAAKECAKRLVNGHDVELWDGVRRVATFKQHKE